MVKRTIKVWMCLLLALPLRAQDYASQLRDYQAQLARSPRNATALAGRGECRLHLGQIQAGLADLDEAARLQPLNPAPYLARSQFYAYQGKRDQALVEARKAVQLYPADALAWVLRARAELALGQSLEAFKSLREARKRDRELADQAATELAPRADRPTRAALLFLEERYQEAIAASDDSAEGYRWRGEALRKLRQFEASMAAFNQSLALSPNSVEALKSRAMLYREAGQVGRALDDLNRVTDLAPGDAEACYYRGLILHLVSGGGHDVDAARNYQGAQARDPLYADPYNAMGSLIWSFRMDAEGLSDQNLEAALSNFNRAIWLNPFVAEYYVNRGLVFYYNNMGKQADLDFERALSLKPSLQSFVATEKSKASGVKSDYARMRFEGWVLKYGTDDQKRRVMGAHRCIKCGNWCFGEDLCAACRRRKS